MGNTKSNELKYTLYKCETMDAAKRELLSMASDDEHSDQYIIARISNGKMRAVRLAEIKNTKDMDKAYFKIGGIRIGIDKII